MANMMRLAKLRNAIFASHICHVAKLMEISIGAALSSIFANVL